jgi:hypothetical protein
MEAKVIGEEIYLDKLSKGVEIWGLEGSFASINSIKDVVS